MAGFFRLSSLTSFDTLNFNKSLDIKILCNEDLSLDEKMMFFTDKGSKRTEWLNSNPHLLEISTFVDNAIHNKINSLKKYPALEVRIVPSHIFGFLHGKFGLFKRKNKKFLFIGSINETYSGFFSNYESIFFSSKPKKKLFDSLDSEFDSFWFHSSVISFNNKFNSFKLIKKNLKKLKKQHKKNGW
jgi:hypothetical protein